MDIKNVRLQTRVISSLEKVFPDEELKADSFNKASAFNEIYFLTMRLKIFEH